MLTETITCDKKTRRSVTLLFALFFLTSAAVVVQAAPAPQDYVLSFENDDVAVAPQSSLLNLGSQFTMETWVYLKGQQAYTVLMGKVNNPRGSDPYMHHVLDLLGDGKLEFVVTTGQAGSYRSIVSPSPLPLNQWVHVAATLNGNDMRLYINGQQVASGFSVGAPTGTDVPFTLGGGVQGFNGQPCCGFTGYLRQARVWNRSLSGQELLDRISRRLDAGEPGLIAQWMLDESAGQSAQDSSGNNLTLQLGTSPNADVNDPRQVRSIFVDRGPFFTLEQFTVQPMGGRGAAGRLIDFDSDGDLDALDFRFVFPSVAGPTIALRNDGAGHFSDATGAVLGTQDIPTYTPRHFAIADFNGDGRKDIFVADHGEDQAPFPGGQSRILIQTADGRMIDETTSRLPVKTAFTHNVAMADIDGDGDLDLYLANIGCGCSTGPELYINDGSGHFTANTSRLPSFVTTLQRKYTASIFMDVNGDNKPDLILGAHPGANPNEGGLRDTILINDGTGNFSAAPDTSLPPRFGGSTWGTMAFEAADFDNDGKTDLLLALTETNYNGGGVQLLLNNGNGTFRDATSNLTQPQPPGGTAWIVWAIPADFNNDGKMDFVTSSISSLRSHLYLNQGGAHFVDVSDLLPFENAIGSAIPGDIDGDGDIDIFGYTGGGGYVVLRNQKPFSVGAKPFDFDGDGKTDVSVFRPGASAEWWVSKSSNNGVLSASFGGVGDQAVPADYTGDGKTDMAFFRPSTGTWYVLRSEDFSFYGFPFGAAADTPAPADYDGDGKADPAVFRSGAWYILRSSDGGVTSASFGAAGDKPVPADYDGDGKADIGIYRPNGGTGGEWWIQRSTAGLLAASFGSAADKTAVGDWTGDGKADCAFFRPSDNTWYVQRSEDMSYFGFPFGLGTDMPAPGDYDGDGKFDAAVFRSSSAAWYVNRSSGGVTSLSFGAAGDVPAPASYVR